jgi:RimJ/RimL family protein N-acetyltransferase
VGGGRRSGRDESSAEAIDRARRDATGSAGVGGGDRQRQRREVGDVVLQPAPFSPGEVELGYHFARRGQHRGFATEAARALVEHAFAVSSLRRLVAAIALGNVSSLKLAARLGMPKVGEVMHAGLRHDLFEVDRETFQAT